MFNVILLKCSQKHWLPLWYKLTRWTANLFYWKEKNTATSNCVQQFIFLHLKSLQHTDFGSQNQLKFILNGSDSTHRKVNVIFFSFSFLNQLTKILCTTSESSDFQTSAVSSELHSQYKHLSICMCSLMEETPPCIESLFTSSLHGTEGWVRLQEEEEEEALLECKKQNQTPLV